MTHGYATASVAKTSNVKRSIFVFLCIVLATALHLFGNNAGTLIILVASILLPVVGLLSLFIPVRELKFCDSRDMIVVANSVFAYVLHTTCDITCYNRLTGEKITDTLTIHAKRTPFAIDSSYCGHLIITIEKVTVTDPFGIFTRCITYRPFAYQTPEKQEHIGRDLPQTYFELTILPRKHNVELLPKSHNVSSNQYSASLAGTDISEIYGIREYQPGDPIRTIHWKLSEKLDKTMVRELGLPTGNDTLLIFDAGKDANPSERDMAATLFFSAMHDLAGDLSNVAVGWVTENGFVKYKLQTPEHIEDIMKNCLQTVDTAGVLPDSL